MNIFATDENPYLSAMALDDSRLGKMLVETAQIMSSALHLRKVPADLILYKATHLGNGLVKWAAEDFTNYAWLTRHFWALKEQFEFRSGKSHVTAQKAACYNMFYEDESAAYFRWQSQDPYPARFHNQAGNSLMGISYLDMGDVIEAYRCYLTHRWLVSEANNKPPRWKGAEPPAWYKDEARRNDVRRRIQAVR